MTVETITFVTKYMGDHVIAIVDGTGILVTINDKGEVGCPCPCCMFQINRDALREAAQRAIESGEATRVIWPGLNFKYYKDDHVAGGGLFSPPNDENEVARLVKKIADSTALMDYISERAAKASAKIIEEEKRERDAEICNLVRVKRYADAEALCRAWGLGFNSYLRTEHPNLT